MTVPDPLDSLRLSMMRVAESCAPMHEFALGEVAYFVREGFTLEQSRAMAAAEFTSAFGLRVENDSTRPENDEGPHPEG